MKKERKRWIAESVGAVDLYAEAVNGAMDEGETTEAPKEEKAAPAPIPKDSTPPNLYEDWSVCAALGLRRRQLIRLRRGLERGVDWSTANGEIGMSEAWCVAHGLSPSRLRKAGAEGLVSCIVSGFVPNPQIVLGKSIESGVVIPIHVRAASDFRKGMLLEAKRGFTGWSIAHGWPRRGS